MKKRIRALLFAGLGLLAAWAVLCLLLENGISLWFFGAGSEEMTIWILLAGLLALLICGGCWLWCRFPRLRVLTVIALLVLALLSGVYFFAVYTFGIAASGYFRFPSPDGEHTIIIREQSAFFNTWGSFYQLTSPFTMQEIGTFSLHDAFPNGDYEIVWLDGCFEVTYCGQTQTVPYLK